MSAFPMSFVLSAMGHSRFQIPDSRFHISDWGGASEEHNLESGICNLNRPQRFGSLGDVGANLVFALITGEGPDEGGRTRGSPLPPVLSRIAEAYLVPVAESPLVVATSGSLVAQAASEPLAATSERLSETSATETI